VADVVANLAKSSPAPGYLEGYQATALAIKANEAVVLRKRV
jgi:hypothetical protein